MRERGRGLALCCSRAFGSALCSMLYALCFVLFCSVLFSFLCCAFFVCACLAVWPGPGDTRNIRRRKSIGWGGAGLPLSAPAGRGQTSQRRKKTAKEEQGGGAADSACAPAAGTRPGQTPPAKDSCPEDTPPPKQDKPQAKPKPHSAGAATAQGEGRAERSGCVSSAWLLGPLLSPSCGWG